MTRGLRRACRAGAGCCAGFTLLEVIVAFALLALALTLLLGTLSGAARQVRHSEAISRASLHAQSLLAQAGVGEALEPGRREGTFDKGVYRWTLEIAPYADSAPVLTMPVRLSSPQLRQLTLEVRWGDEPGQAMRWQTLRLVPAEGIR
ncbi:type II secretion system protein XpsI [Pseudoxanthomonas suwonensis]|uniref:General secretion pathway protein GspI n=1 Tax=Pseudoxanthomonas suwonensis TaxID=314722 RepID=A0A0E3UPR6_9GAMM|nr:prepilin-type N-terminal cleavage/methylation domain-containing protein [Pseudoxanthomonas suwonensis]AKC88050.1 general secretion pathway protein GspI [Pseudoxanthomonas suwonensis]